MSFIPTVIDSVSMKSVGGGCDWIFEAGGI
jgi:hypothetical protein